MLFRLKVPPPKSKPHGLLLYFTISFALSAKFILHSANALCLESTGESGVQGYSHEERVQIIRSHLGTPNTEALPNHSPAKDDQLDQVERGSAKSTSVKVDDRTKNNNPTELPIMNAQRIQQNEQDETQIDPRKILWPEAKTSYTPKLPDLGQYSVADACPTVHYKSATSVTLKDGETLAEAHARLAQLTTPEAGGIIEVPYDVDTVQCDTFAPEYSLTNKLTIKGIPGPNDELPLFYCRFANKNHEGKKQLGFVEGTIPYKTSAFLTGGGPYGSFPHILVENLHIDGYRGVFHTNSYYGRYIFRRLFAHHGRGNGFFHDGTSFIYLKDKENGTDRWHDEHILEFHVCGSEISHTGQGNGQHGLYLHGTFGGVDPDNPLLQELTGNNVNSWHKTYFVDNFVHDTNNSSAYKSLGDEQIIVGNRFYHVYPTDPTFKSRPSSMLIDIPACSLAKIIGNEFVILDGKYGIAFRNRRPPHRGCDMPAMWDPGLKRGENRKVLQPEPIPGPWHTEDWWRDLGRKQFFTLLVENNIFRQDPNSQKSKGRPITNMGTYPNFQSGFGGDSCYLPTPMSWYERSNVIARNNTYIGLDEENNYGVAPPLHNYKGRCPTDQPPPGPMPAKNRSEYYTIGSGEQYKRDNSHH